MHTCTVTTDLQGISVVVTEAKATIEVMCDFIPGSDAEGCMVVLVGELDNTIVNLTRDDDCTIKTLSLSTPLSDVFGFDIESDGSVGTLPISGIITPVKTSDDPLCQLSNSVQTLHVLGEYCSYGIKTTYNIHDFAYTHMYRYAMDYYDDQYLCYSFASFC